MDCGDNSCMYAIKRGGMRTNGGCRCLSAFESHASQEDGRVFKYQPMRMAMNKYAQETRRELTAAHSRIEDLLASRAMDDEQFRQDRARIADLEAKLAKREAQLVWAVRHGAELEGDRVWWFRILGEDSGVVDIECDGTPAGLLAAIDAATEER